MEQLHIVGGRRLHGQVRISGAKNAVLKLMAASLLVENECIRCAFNAKNVLTADRGLRNLGVELSWKSASQSAAKKD